MHSNCLFEAIKAKIKDPKNVHIFKLPKNFGGSESHFMWYNEVTHKYYHSKVSNDEWLKLNPLKKTIYKLWHDQKIKEVDEAFFNALIYRNFNVYGITKKEKVNILRKAHLRIGKMDTGWHSNLIDYQDSAELPSKEDADFLKKTFKVDPIVKIVYFLGGGKRELGYCTFTALIKLPCRKNFKWRWLNPLEEDFANYYKIAAKYVDEDYKTKI